MAQVPSNLIPTSILQLPTSPVASPDSYLIISYQGRTYKITAGNLVGNSYVPTTRQIIAGTGLSGGGALSGDVTLSIASTGVTPNTYGGSTAIPVITVDATGRITSATTASISGGGTVTGVSVASNNGFAGTSSGGATPALTLSTTVTGLLKGNGTSISAATSGTDYAPATSGNSILYGNGAGGFSPVTIGSNLTFAGGTLSATGGGGSGTVTQVNTTGSVSGITLTGGPITGTGTVTLGGSLNLSSPPAIGGTTPAAITGTTVTVRTELDFPTVTTDNVGTGVIKMVDGGDGSGYDVLEIYSDDSGTPYTVRFPGGIQGAPMYLLSPDYLTNYHYINLTTPSGMTVDYTLQFPPTAGSANQYLKTDGTGVLSWATISGTGTVTTSGSPTTNYLSKFTGSTVIGNSLVYDNGTSVGIGTASPSAAYKLDILGDLQAGSSFAGKIATNPTWNGGSTPLKITIPNYTTYWGMVIQNATYGGNSGLEIGVGDTGYANIGITDSAGVPYNAIQILPGGNIFLLGTMNFGAAGTDTIALVGQVSANGSVGSSGKVLASRGANQSPQWVTPAVTTAGVFTNISSSTAPTLTVPALALTGTPNSSTSAKTGVLGIGPNFTATDKNILASFVQGINDYTQIVTQNTNAGTTASADFIVNNDSTTGAGTYGDFGINSSGFTGTGSFSAPNSVYLYSQGGDLVVGTQSANIVRFVVGSSTASDAGTITSTGLNAFPIGATTASTGAFTTLSASSTVSGTGFSTYLASPPAIGGTTAAAGAFTTLSASSTVSGTGFSTYLASPPAIGGTTAAAGTFTTLVANTSIGAGVASPSALVNIKAGTATASTAPLKFTSGTNLTAVEAGAVEYDGTKWYATTGETGSSRSVLDNSYQYYVNTSAGGIGTADLFASAAFTMQAGGIYVIEWHSYLTKATAGTLTFTVTTSQTPQSVTAGFCNAQSALTASNAVVAGATTTTAMPASASIANNAVVYIPVRAVVTANASTGGTVKLQVTNSAGTVTLGRGSHIIVRRLSGSTTVGAFA